MGSIGRSAGRMVRGAAAGAVGTLAMDLLWWSRSRRGGSDDDFLTWEFTEADSFDDAGAPAQVGQRVADLVGVELPDHAAGTTNDVVHWLTGIGNGVVHGLTNDGSRPVRSGLRTGVTAFATSYGILGAAGIYDPIWEYDDETLVKDLSAHLLYGLTVGLAHGLLSSDD